MWLLPGISFCNIQSKALYLLCYHKVTYKMDQNLIWKALSDPTRRSIMDLLRESPKTTGALSEAFGHMSRFAIMKHLGILEKATLITVKREGKFRWNYINPLPIQEIYERWVKKYEAQWSGNLLALRNFTELKFDDMSMTNTVLSATKVAVEVTINSPLERVWKIITEQTGAWWREDFYTSPKTKNFVIDNKIGGKMYEDFGNGEGLVWADVIGIDAPNVIEFRGNLSPAFGGPAISFLKIELSAVDGATKVSLTDDIFGKIGENAKASMTEGWDLLLGHGLKPYAEKGSQTQV